MILSVSELRDVVDTNKSDIEIEMILDSLEMLIRAYTNNKFQIKTCRSQHIALGGVLIGIPHSAFNVGDTVEISQSKYNDGVYVIMDITDEIITLNKQLIDEDFIVLTKVQYPIDIKFGTINLVKWELTGRDKVNVVSETLSRHSVTYVNMDDNNTLLGYPKTLVGFLKPYMKARF